MPRCKTCAHYKKAYMPYLKRFTMECELDGKKSSSCKKEYIYKGDVKDEMPVQDRSRV